MKNDRTGIIILSHGTIVKKANASFVKTIRIIQRKTGLGAIVPAYLQFCQPDLERSVKGLVSKGHRMIIIIPYFLFYGNHVTRDIPHIIKKERERYPEVNFICTKNLGEDTRISDIVADIIKEAVQKDSA